MGKKQFIVIALLLLLMAALTGWFVMQYFQSPARQFKQPLIELSGGETTAGVAVQAAAGGDDAVTVKMYFPAPGGISGKSDEGGVPGKSETFWGEGITVEERRIQNNPIPVRMAEAVVSEYLKGLGEGLKDTKLLGIYRDKKGIIYVDVSDDFRKNFSADVRQEFAFLKSLYETIMVNVPGTEDVRLLVDGKEVESVGGHFSSLYLLGETVKDDPRQPASPVAPKN